MFEIGNFDMIDTEGLEEYLDEEVGEADKSDKTFDASSVLSESTIDAGYDSSNVILNSTLNLVILALTIGIALIVLLLRLLCYKF